MIILFRKISQKYENDGIIVLLWVLEEILPIYKVCIHLFLKRYSKFKDLII